MRDEGPQPVVGGFFPIPTEVVCANRHPLPMSEFHLALLIVWDHNLIPTVQERIFKDLEGEVTCLLHRMTPRDKFWEDSNPMPG